MARAWALSCQRLKLATSQHPQAPAVQAQKACPWPPTISCRQTKRPKPTTLGGESTMHHVGSTAKGSGPRRSRRRVSKRETTGQQAQPKTNCKALHTVNPKGTPAKTTKALPTAGINKVGVIWAQKPSCPRA